MTYQDYLAKSKKITLDYQTNHEELVCEAEARERVLTEAFDALVDPRKRLLKEQIAALEAEHQLKCSRVHSEYTLFRTPTWYEFTAKQTENVAEYNAANDKLNAKYRKSLAALEVHRPTEV